MIRANRIIVRRLAAIGDSLCATVVADRLIELGYEVIWQTHPSIHCVIRRHPRISAVTELICNPDINLDGAYEKDPQRRRKHFHAMFFEAAQRQLNPMGINLGAAFNCRPSIRLSPQERTIAQTKFKDYPRPWVFICPRSDTYAARQVPDGIWQAAAAKIQGTKFWLGRHPGPAGIVDLKCQHLDNVIVWLSAADLLVSVDTGPLHLAAAMGIQVLGLGQSSSPECHLSDQRDFMTIEPKLDYLNCQDNICPKNPDVPPCQSFDPEFIAAWANAKLDGIRQERVSAIISIYRPEVGTLNRCLECVLPQVDEVIVCRDMAGIEPVGALKHPKIRYVLSPQHNIGYGRKQNFAARHSSGKLLLLCNDDLFLEPDAVARMKEEMKPGVGLVCNLLLYPDRSVYFAGKSRGFGQMGWGHMNHKQRHWDLKVPTELENACGACNLVSRKAFYDIGGFDEDFMLFGEDDDFSLRMRQAGYKIMFTPHSVGIHLEHQSVNKTGDIMTMVQNANRIFNRKWGWYLEHNRNRVPGTFV